ncbi:MAG: redox-sensing transcriptional repressor Rex [Lachnospiraceae bacterium]|nr:redox-sensing transcriptional repressor Rex [Lachnospiraceae bacterium]MDE6253582.1 redox-sensing transcriptional repressor Rex [Lachnospiraceae bacterium]
MVKNGISTAVIKRLPRYYRYLGELMEAGTERISSNELSKLMNVTASQIRQDLNNFGGFGQQGYGYNVEFLYSEIGKLLGVDRRHNIIVVGSGHLGQAIANYANFERRGFIVKGMFDKNPDVIGKEIRGIKVMSMEEIEEFIRINKIEIAALTLPKQQAAEMAEKLVKFGIRGFWNFAHIDLELPKGIVVENVHLSESLMRLSYNLTTINDK